ncbi:MAG TPA: polymer-forming cytoskeletal protein [Ktedonobacterales bacterium]
MPRVVSLFPQVTNASLSTTQWFSAWSGPSAPSGAVADLSHGSLGSAPLACSTQSASAVGSNLTVPANEWVCGDALAVGGNVDVQGHVQGSAQSLGGNVTISGEVDGDVTAIGGNITVAPTGITHGSLRAVGGRVILAQGTVQTAAAPNTQGSWWQMHQTRPMFHPVQSESGSFWLGLLFWISASVGLTAFVPEAVGHVRFTIARRMLVSGVSGAVIALIGVFVGGILFLTCLGIPVTLLIALALWVAWVVGTVAFGSWLGATFLRGLRHGRDSSLLISTLVGVLILSLLKSLPVAGIIISFIVGCVAVGAAALTLLSARRVSYAHLRW